MSVEQRIADLERKLKTTTAISWVLGLLLIGVAVLTQIPLRTPQVLFVGDRNAAHARVSPDGIFLVDAEGRPRAAMDLADTGPRIALFDAKGAEGGAMKLDGDGVSLGLKAANGALVYMSADSAAAALLVDAGNGRSKLAVNAQAAEATMALDAGKQQPGVKFAAGASGASIVAANPTVPVSAALFTANDAGGFAVGRADSPGKLSKQKNTAAVMVSVTAAGQPAMELRRASGRSRVVVPPTD